MAIPDDFLLAQLKTTTIIDDFVAENEQFYLDVATADVFFDSVDNKDRLPAHKNVLAARSPVFQRMFNEESLIGQLMTEDLDVFEEFLQVFYKPNIELHLMTVDIVMKFAKKYEVEQCFQICVAYLTELVNIMQQICDEIKQEKNFFKRFYAYWNKLKLDVSFTDAVCIMHETAVDFGCTELVAKLERFIGKYGSYVIDGLEHSMYVAKKDLKMILSIDFENRDEFGVFGACFKHVTNHDPLAFDCQVQIDLRQIFGESFDYIRFGAMTPQQFNQLASIYTSTFNEFDCQRIEQEIVFKQQNNIQ